MKVNQKAIAMMDQERRRRNVVINGLESFEEENKLEEKKVIG